MSDYAKLHNQVPSHLQQVTTIQTPGVRPPGKAVVGFGLAAKVGGYAAQLAQGRALLVTDKTITGLGLHQVVLDSLAGAGFAVDVFDGVDPEPPVETAAAIQNMLRREGHRLVVGLGGGSAMDMAKCGALGATNPQDITAYLRGSPIEKEGLPLILLPTTSGTGSEVSPFIALTDGNRKVFISNPYVFPTIAVVDPLLTATMPPSVTASTGWDALSHAVEGLIAGPSPYAEALSAKAVEYVFTYLPRAYADGADLEARYYMAWASVLGMMAYAQAGGLYAHSLSYILTLHHGVPHGVGCGVSLPYTLMLNVDHIQPILLRFARALASVPGAGPTPDPAGSPEQAALDTIRRFHGLLKETGMPSSLKDLNVDESALNVYARELVEQYYRPKNPRPIGLEEASRLVRAMWEGELARI